MGEHVTEPTPEPADFLWWKAQRKAAREAFRDIEYELTTNAPPVRGSVFSEFHRAFRTPHAPRAVKRPASGLASPQNWRAAFFPAQRLRPLRKRPDPDLPNGLVSVGMFVLLLLVLIGLPS